jgi:hypothetical protein
MSTLACPTNVIIIVGHPPSVVLWVAPFEMVPVAEQKLLRVVDMMLGRRLLVPSGTEWRNVESLVAAHEGLWRLRHLVLDS